ncbi:hypothetical protein ACH4ND_29865 [Streptomyces sp. NPDC017179]|uniref:hypothetical protein n=1 Tax=Streptomyces sp. NPDC017179 TaxID=3364979 RepID=UPI0037BBD463
MICTWSAGGWNSLVVGFFLSTLLDFRNAGREDQPYRRGGPRPGSTIVDMAKSL